MLPTDFGASGGPLDPGRSPSPHTPHPPSRYFARPPNPIEYLATYLIKNNPQKTQQ